MLFIQSFAACVCSIYTVNERMDHNNFIFSLSFESKKYKPVILPPEKCAPNSILRYTASVLTTKMLGSQRLADGIHVVKLFASVDYHVI